ncbi:hypothetical protein [Clostridium sp. C2-6-12]|uniref:hypothetical protein n=1 Tax=Clostridium sp. C2-6-12 TaxID=2698832 RepID=UPI001369C5D5|nr:hypothetical protein [Clostridium sp. C2-6-12]
MIKKLILGSLVIATTFAITPINASATWQHDAKGTWYTEGDSYATGWRYLEHYGGWQWSLFDDKGYVKTGWFQDGGNWYYADTMNKYILRDTYIDGYYLNKDGILSTDTSNSRASESAVKATLEIAKKLEDLGWIKNGPYWNDRATLYQKSYSKDVRVNTRCEIVGGVAKVYGVTKAQTYEEWRSHLNEDALVMSLDDYLKYKADGRIASINYYESSIGGTDKFGVIEEYLSNQPIKTTNTATSTNKTTTSKWNSHSLEEYLKKQKELQETGKK